ncbi:MAG TPA: DUF6159 family protein [Ktedonobacterales bacterium]
MGRFARSWQLFKQSWAVLRSDKALIVFPIVSSIATLIVMASFFIPLALSGAFAQIAAARAASVSGTAGVATSAAVWAPYIVIAFLFYLVQYFVIFFANSALVGAALLRLQGGHPTVGDGFRIAARHTWTILGYAAIAATVGMVLRAIAERSGWIGRIVVGILGIGWTLATALVVPVLVTENIGPVASIKRSTSLLKRTWGEQIIGNLGMGAVFGLVSFGVVIVGVVLGVLAVMSGAIALLVAVIVVGVLALMALGIVSSALSGIYRAAVYRFAATGEVGGGFDADLVRGAFRPRKSRVPFLS